jgi:BASS family bile acid:Na+ symporter
MQSTVSDVFHLLRRPSLLFRSILAMNVLTPLLAIIMALSFNLSGPMKVALLLIAVSPVPPLLPRQQQKMGGSSGYVCGLLAGEALLAVVLVPITVVLMGRLFSHDVYVAPRLVAKVVLMTVLLPLGLGILVQRFLPRQAKVLGKPLSGLAFVLFALSCGALLLAVAPVIFGMTNSRVILAIVIFVGVAVAVGHWLGGPDPSDRTVLALATASRHPGLAIAIAASTFPPFKQQIAALILLYVLIRIVVLIPYNVWQKRSLLLRVNREHAPDRQAA